MNVHGGVAADDGPGGHVTRHAALRRDLCPVADAQVAGRPDLSAQANEAPDARAAGQAHLGGQGAAFADRAPVRHHDQVVELGAAPDHRRADGGAIDRRVGADFDVVFDHHRARLDDLARRAVGRRARSRSRRRR